VASDPVPDSLPTTVLTGFLGSGKTTLLRQALGSPALNDTAVIINEIGEIAIDHHLVDFVEGNVLELPGGCLCCAVREDLAATLRDLLERRESGAVRPFRRVAIETSGLADPAPILYTLGVDPFLDGRLHLGRVVTVVDAVTGAASLARFPEAARQAAVADALAISKTDLAPPSAELAAALDALNPGAERISTAAIDPGELLFAPLPASGAREGPTAQPWEGEGGVPQAEHSHGIDSFAVVLRGAMTRLDFAKALGALAMARGTDLLRVKGIVEFADRPGRPAAVHGAQHAIFPPEWLDAWPDADRRSRLVFIVQDIDRAEILAHFAFADPELIGQRASRPYAHAAPLL
jgi:G3E family GTPase